MLLFLRIYALHWRRKGVLCVGESWITVEQDCEACICEAVFNAVANSNADLDMAHKIQIGKLFVLEERIWTTKNIRRDVWSMLLKNLAKPTKMVKKNKSVNQDSTNNSLAHLEETLDNEDIDGYDGDSLL